MKEQNLDLPGGKRQITDSAYKRQRLMWQLGNRVQEHLAQYRLPDTHDLD